jgi:AcrR family transcriptional regulator
MHATTAAQGTRNTLCPEVAHRAGEPATDRTPQQTRREEVEPLELCSKTARGALASSHDYRGALRRDRGVRRARGFTAATVADIVDHSAASFGSIYHHFGGKKQLFLAIFDRLAADIDRCIEATADRVAALDRQQTFEANARAHLKPIWQTGAPRWCWLPATTRPASTGSAATARSAASAAGCRYSSSTLRRGVSYRCNDRVDRPTDKLTVSGPQPPAGQ